MPEWAWMVDYFSKEKEVIFAAPVGFVVCVSLAGIGIFFVVRSMFKAQLDARDATINSANERNQHQNSRIEDQKIDLAECRRQLDEQKLEKANAERALDRGAPPASISIVEPETLPSRQEIAAFVRDYVNELFLCTGALSGMLKSRLTATGIEHKLAADYLDYRINTRIIDSSIRSAITPANIRNITQAKLESDLTRAVYDYQFGMNLIHIAGRQIGLDTNSSDYKIWNKLDSEFRSKFKELAAKPNFEHLNRHFPRNWAEEELVSWQQLLSNRD